MKNIAILIPLWGRKGVWELVADRLQEFIHDNFMYSFKVFCIVSPEDPQRKELEAICTKYGYTMFHCKNEPLGEKMNYGIRNMMQRWPFHYLMNLGSDNIMHPDLIKKYEPYMTEGVRLFGIKECVVYSKKQSVYFDFGKRAMGAGRMIHRDILEKMFSAGHPLYNPECERGLDGNSSSRINYTTGHREKIVELPTDKLYMVDIKTRESLNSMQVMLSQPERIKRKALYFDAIGKNYSDFKTKSLFPL